MEYNWDLIPGLPDDVAEECLIRVAFHRLLVLRFVCHRWKQMVFSHDFHRQRRLAGKTTSLFVASHYSMIRTGKHAGQDQFILFDPQLETWYPLHHIPVQPPGTYYVTHFNTVVGVGYSLVIIREDSLQIYDLLKGSWRKAASVPGPSRHSFAYTTDGHRRIIISGGHCSDNRINVGSSILSYDIEEDVWESLPEIVDGCQIIDLLFHDGTLYAFTPLNLFSSHVIMYCMDLFITSDRKWKGPQSIMNTKGYRYSKPFAIAEGGKFYYISDNKLWFKDGEILRVLLDLPFEIKGPPFMSSWNGNILVDPLGYNEPFGVYTLMLKGENQSLLWRSHIMPGSDQKVGLTEMKTCLEI